MSTTKPKKTKRIRPSTLLILLLMLVGLGVLLYPTACDTYYRWKVSREIAQYNSVAQGTDADYSALWEAAEAYNATLAAKGSFTISATAEMEAEISQLLNPLGTGMMGYIDIPSINVHIPIYQGTDEAALQAGAGYWIGTSLPTGGASTHCVLTAHNGLTKARMFTDIDQLELGDTFTLTILDRTLTYQVDQILVVEPNDFTEMNIVEGEDYVTLYTCYPYGVNTHRLLVRGTRIETPVESEATVLETLSTLNHWSLLLILLAILLILLALLLPLLVRRRNRRLVEKQQI